MPSWAEHEAFVEESRAVEATLAGAAAEPDAASRPGLGDWSLGRLVGHLVGTAARVRQRLSLPPPEAGRTEIDRVGFYVRHMAIEASGTFQPVDDPELADPSTWSEEFAEAWQGSDDALTRADPDQTLVSTTFGVMTAREYLATRVLEVCVHHLDVRVALDLSPAPTPEAGKIAQEILERLLDGPRPRNLGRTRFIRAATGRGGYDDARFPVLR